MPDQPKKRFHALRRWLLKGFLLFLGVSFAQVGLFRTINPPFNGAMIWDRVAQDGSLLRRWKKAGWIPLRRISPHLRRAVLAGEDQRFLSHNGFDWTELSLAVQDVMTERGARGASTITMQAARTVFLWPGRSWVRKILEAHYTVLMELLWSKARILEVYLNMVDWGHGCIGGETAANGYFGRSACCLTAQEAAAMAAVLPNPDRWSPVLPDGWVLKRQERIIRDMAFMPLVQ